MRPKNLGTSQARVTSPLEQRAQNWHVAPASLLDKALGGAGIESDDNQGWATHTTYSTQFSRNLRLSASCSSTRA